MLGGYIMVGGVLLPAIVFIVASILLALREKRRVGQ